MPTIRLKKALEKLGYEVVQYHKGFNYRYGFMKKEGEIYYFSFSDLRDANPRLLVRTANPDIKNKKGEYADWTGGNNTYPNLSGYTIVEPRSTKDYNSN